jgi:hypothetical protein
MFFGSLSSLKWRSFGHFCDFLLPRLLRRRSILNFEPFPVAFRVVILEFLNVAPRSSSLHAISTQIYQILWLSLFLFPLSLSLSFKPSKACRDNEFRCNDGTCVPGNSRCNRRQECPDGSDEANCPAQRCRPGEFQCATGQCISESARCDRRVDCRDGSDERECRKYFQKTIHKILAKFLIWCCLCKIQNRTQKRRPVWLFDSRSFVKIHFTNENRNFSFHNQQFYHFYSSNHPIPAPQLHLLNTQHRNKVITTTRAPRVVPSIRAILALVIEPRRRHVRLTFTHRPHRAPCIAIVIASGSAAQANAFSALSSATLALIVATALTNAVVVSFWVLSFF